MTTKSLSEAALRYAELGYPVFPCAPGGKVPLTKHGFKDASTDPERIEAWWKRHPNANIGIPTAGLLVVDIDGENNVWLSDDPEKCADLARGALSLTPGGGRHYVFRQPEGRAWGNTSGKLAPKVDTRGNGGYIVAPPSVIGGKVYCWAETLELDAPPGALPEPPGWLVAVLDNGYPRTPTIKRSLMVPASENENPNGFPSPPAYPASESPPVTPTFAPCSPQGEDSDAGGNMIPSGHRNATLARLAGTMRRVGMGYAEIRAALVQSNADRCKPPLGMCEVDRIAASICRYEPDQVAVAVVEDHWAQMVADPAQAEPAAPAPSLPDPGPLPPELLRVPGFVSEVMDHVLDVAPYPSVALSFGGALALQATLAGRKVRDPGDNRTNLYLLALAYSSVGKNKPRQINDAILQEAGLEGCIGGRFASGEGLEDSLAIDPCKMYQTDEIDAILQSINKAKDARHEQMMATLLTMYSSANASFAMRRKAGKESPGAIDQPCLVVFGTAIPNHYYQALSERMLTNGFFARMVILECEKRQPGQEPKIAPIPKRVIETAKWWADLRPGTGNLEQWHPVPKIVPHTEDAKRLLVEMRLEAEAEYGKAEDARDPVGTTVWGRVSEHVRKLALVYAVSESHENPNIGREAVEWARAFVTHQARRMLHMAQSHVAENPFHADCLKLMQKLREAADRTLPHSALLKRMKMDAQTFFKLIQTLEQSGDIEVVTVPRAGAAKRSYRLRGECRERGESCGETRGEG